MKPSLTGIYPIAPATFSSNGSVDLQSYRHSIELMLRGGCAGITLFGIAGEYYKLSLNEEIEFIKATVDVSRQHGKTCIISNTRHSTEVAVEWSVEIERRGADCMMVLPPFFLRPGGDELYRHMKTVGAAVSIPVIIQYAPELTGVAMAPEVLIRLHKEVPNIIYYKIECKPPGHYISRLLEMSNGTVGVFIGNAGFQMVEGLDRGACGVMPGPSMYDLYVQIFNSYRNGDRKRAISLHKELVYMLNHIRQSVEMIISYEKHILQLRGIVDSDYCRHPTYPFDNHDTETFKEIFSSLKTHLLPISRN